MTPIQETAAEIRRHASNLEWAAKYLMSEYSADDIMRESLQYGAATLRNMANWLPGCDESS